MAEGSHLELDRPKFPHPHVRNDSGQICQDLSDHSTINHSIFKYMIEEKSGYSNGILRYPVSVVDHKETIKDPVQDDVNELKDWKTDQETEIPDGQIKGIKEIEDFLEGSDDATTLIQYVASVVGTMEMDDQNGDITIEYDDGTVEDDE